MSNKKKLLRLTESLLSRPHLISQAGFSAIYPYLNSRNSGIQLMSDGDGPEYVKPSLNVAGKVGILKVHGALTYKPVEGLCGAVGTSYQQLLADSGELMDMGCKIIVMDCDSGGGEGYAAFETANELRSMANADGVRLIAYNDGDCASACYAIACAADEIIANPAAETGSIGVLIALVNDSGALEKAGDQRSFISAGAQKIPFDESGGFKEEFLAGLQVKVDAMYEQFVSHVSSHTGMSVDAIRGTEARMFMAQEALQLGLINKVMTRAEFIDYIATQTKETT